MDPVDEEIEECSSWSDERLTMALAEAVRDERRQLRSLLIRLGEFFARDLSMRKGYPSVYEYCIRVLGYSRTAAARRIHAARLGRRFRSVLTMLERGEFNLTVVAMLARHVTPENHEALLRRARGKSEEEIARIIATISPGKPPTDRIRIVSITEGAPATSGSPLPASDGPVLVPAEGSPTADLFGGELPASLPHERPEVWEVRFAASKETAEAIRRAQELLRHRFPSGELDGIVRLALTELLSKLDRDRRSPARQRAGRRAAKKGRRYIPETVKREVWKRDGGQCAYVAPDGTRCTARARLEFDHKTPFALGGSSLEAGGVRLLCKAHNAWLGRQVFGGPVFDGNRFPGRRSMGRDG